MWTPRALQSSTDVRDPHEAKRLSLPTLVASTTSSTALATLCKTAATPEVPAHARSRVIFNDGRLARAATREPMQIKRSVSSPLSRSLSAGALCVVWGGLRWGSGPFFPSLPTRLSLCGTLDLIDALLFWDSRWDGLHARFRTDFCGMAASVVVAMVVMVVCARWDRRRRESRCDHEAAGRVRGGG